MDELIEPTTDMKRTNIELDFDSMADHSSLFTQNINCSQDIATAVARQDLVPINMDSMTEYIANSLKK